MKEVHRRTGIGFKSHIKCILKIIGILDIYLGYILQKIMRIFLSVHFYAGKIEIDYSLVKFNER